MESWLDSADSVHFSVLIGYRLPNRYIDNIRKILRPDAIWVEAIENLNPAFVYIRRSRTAYGAGRFVTVEARVYLSQPESRRPCSDCHVLKR